MGWLTGYAEYDEALMWDQLRNAMKDHASNPFEGFEEGPIDFPPTFKYDVSISPVYDPSVLIR
jgi:hypothetical protein